MAAMTLELGGEEREVPIGVAALMVYEQQFHSDMVQDLLGRSVIRSHEDEDDVVFAVDYRDTNWTACLKAAWACLKAADGNFVRWEDWVSEVGDVNLNELAERVIPAAFEAFFRTGAGLSE